jgi:hypothetical protein
MGRGCFDEFFFHGEKISTELIWEEILSRNRLLSFFYEKCRADFRTKFLFSDWIFFLPWWKNPENENFGKKITTTKISC